MQCDMWQCLKRNKNCFFFPLQCWDTRWARSQLLSCIPSPSREFFLSLKQLFHFYAIPFVILKIPYVHRHFKILQYDISSFHILALSYGLAILIFYLKSSFLPVLDISVFLTAPHCCSLRILYRVTEWWAGLMKTLRCQLLLSSL